MEIRHIEVFVAIVKENGFTRAAERLGITQPTVSLHLQTLEKELGVKLIDRDGRKVMLTPAGRIFYKYAQQIVDLVDKAKLEVKRFLGSIEGTFTIGASTVPGDYILPRVLPGFVREYPKTRFVVKVGDSEEIGTAVAEAEIDLGIVGARLDDERLEFKPLCRDEVVVVAPSDFDVPETVDAEGLKGLPIVMREPGSGTRKAFEKALEDLGLKVSDLNIVAVVGSTTAVKEAVRHGMGCGIVSKLSVSEELERGILKVIEVKGLLSTREFLVCTLKHRTLAPAIELFIDYLTKSGIYKMSW